LKAGNVSGFGEILTNAHGFSLYGLSDEFGGKLACTGECLKFWPPVLVSKSATKVSLGAGVTGEIGFVARSATTKQVTFDGYPLYTFVKDSGPGQKHGEGVVAFGGTWGLLRASSLILPAKAAAATSTTSTTAASMSTTSTTAASGYCGSPGPSGPGERPTFVRRPVCRSRLLEDGARLQCGVLSRA
jgi:predicted lipoprotein with Yx(FWY)xxD motif